MKPISQLLRRLVDHGGDRYTYATDPRFGPTHAEHVPDQWVRTTCGYCSVGCGILLGTKGDRAVACKGDPDHPVNAGRLCPKGLSEHLTIGATGRLRTPMLGKQPVSWDAALEAMVDEFTRLTTAHGPEAVAVISTGQLVTEEFYALGKLVRLGLGLVHYCGNTTLCMASAVSGYKLSFGTDGPPSSYDDLALADCLIMIGANVADNHPLLVPRLMENRHGTLVVADPRVTKTAMLADIHLAVRPRSDITLLNGIIRILFEEDLVDHEFIAAHTSGASALRAAVDAYTVEHVAAECGIDAADLVRVAHAFGRAERAMVAWTMGVNHSVQGTETVALINTLCLITGNIGRPGTGPFSITGQCNAMGTRETGFTGSMPGYRSFDDPAHRLELANLWGIDEARIPTDRGRAYPDIINAIVNGRVKALWVIGTNPVVSFPNREVLEFALGRLEFLVVSDGFETPTTEMADLVLPAAIWGEKDGTFTNSERRVSRVRKAVEPPGEARSDFDVILDIADRLGVRDELFPGWKVPEDAFEEWRVVSRGRPCDYSGITYERIEREGGVQWPSVEADTAPGGTPRLYTDGVFNTPDGRARLRSVEPTPIADQPRPQYPFLLNTGRTVEHWHTRTKTGKVPILERLAPEAWVEIHPDDADRLGLRAGDSVRLRSSRGSVEPVAVRVSATVRPGEVFLPFHYDEACANRLTPSEFDPISREPNYKQSAVAIERLHA
ncbi:MAG TPA: nitrate reductase [Ilumatobacter sp.]|nr:nitrate reductase [Ilumatobacter sp.]